MKKRKTIAILLLGALIMNGSAGSGATDVSSDSELINQIQEDQSFTEEIGFGEEKEQVYPEADPEQIAVENQAGSFSAPESTDQTACAENAGIDLSASGTDLADPVDESGEKADIVSENSTAVGETKEDEIETLPIQSSESQIAAADTEEDAFYEDAEDLSESGITDETAEAGNASETADDGSADQKELTETGGKAEEKNDTAADEKTEQQEPAGADEQPAEQGSLTDDEVIAETAEECAVEDAQQSEQDESDGEGQRAAEVSQSDDGLISSSNQNESEKSGSVAAEEPAEKANSAAEESTLPDDEVISSADEYVLEGTQSEQSDMAASSFQAGMYTGGEADQSKDAESGKNAGQDPETQSQPKAQISELQYKTVETNSKYNSLQFEFQDPETGKEYVCFITGLKTDEKPEDESLTILASEIADGFLSGEKFQISSTDAISDFGLKIDVIDAEKMDMHQEGDHNICWAASAADMLEFSGWNADQNGNEDTIMQEFRENFSDLGGYQEAGISWYMNGVNTEQYINTNGEIAYASLDHGAAQQQEPGTGGHWKEYAALEQTNQTNINAGIKDSLEKAAEQLSGGGSIGLGAYFYQDGQYTKKGHSLSVFGYIREKMAEAIGNLKALFISDSDDDAVNQTSAPETRDNKYTMYHVEDYSNGTLDSVEIKGYTETTNPQYQTVIGLVTTLQPKETAAKETEGTMDAVTNVNIVPESLSATNENEQEIQTVEAGKAFFLNAQIGNKAYAGVPKNSEIKYLVTVMQDGTVISTDEMSLYTDEDGVLPMESVSSKWNMQFDAVGGYEIGFEVLGILDEYGNEIKEAYIRDNQLDIKKLKLSVTEEKEDSETQKEEASSEKQEPAEDADEAGEPEATDNASENEEKKDAAGDSNPIQEAAQENYHEEADHTGSDQQTNVSAKRASAEKVYKLVIVLGEPETEEYSLDFKANIRAEGQFTELVNRGSGEIVPAECYTIKTKDSKGIFTIIFSKDIFEYIVPGDNHFVLRYPQGRVLINVHLI